MSWIEFEQGGKKHRFAIARSGEGVWIGWPGGAKFFGPEQRDGARAAREEREVRAPMTGRVVKVLARPGAAVRAREVLVILEAMKMEYRLTAPKDGAIEAVSCKEGELVDLGRTLVTLAP